MLKKIDTSGMKKLMVAIISLMLILVTTISYSAFFAFAEDNEPAQEQPAQEQPAQEQPVQEQPVQEQPAQEQPVQEQPAQEQPVQEQPAQEQPVQEQPAQEQPVQEQPAEAALSQMSASSWIVMSGSTSQIVAQGHAERKMQPGAMTMLMTAMVAIDNMYNEDELKNTVVISSELAEEGTLFKEGETVTVGDLLSAMLVAGDSQAAEALAEYSASSREIFINEMNSKCMELDIMDTQFINPGGTYADKQYSTAKDCAVIAQAAIRYQRIKYLLKKKSVIVRASTKENEREIELVSCNPLLAGSPDQTYKYIKGGIRGVLDKPSASMQYAAISMKDGMEMVAILMDSDPALAAAEARSLLEYGDAGAEKNVIVKAGKRMGTARVKGGVWTRVAGYTETKGYAYVPPEGSDKLIQTQVVMLDNLQAPLKEGEKVGEFRIYVADELKGTVDLVTHKEIGAGWPPSQWYISNLAAVIISMVILLILAFIIRVLSVKRRRAKRAEAMRKAKIREIARKQLEVDEDRKRRNWTGYGYDGIPLRTTSVRKESLKEVQGSDEKGRDK